LGREGAGAIEEKEVNWVEEGGEMLMMRGEGEWVVDG